MTLMYSLKAITIKAIMAPTCPARLIIEVITHPNSVKALYDNAKTLHNVIDIMLKMPTSAASTIVAAKWQILS